jgi:glycosyltransferase involved in cell wall biosynthesis
VPTVLAVNNYYYFRGGSEAVFFQQNRALSELGWTVIPFAMKHPENLPTEWASHFVERNELGGEQPLASKLARLPSVIYSVEAKRKLARLLSVVTPDVCHAHNIYHHISPAILGLLRARGIPTVLTVHDLKIVCPAYTMLTHDGVCERCRGGRLHNVVVHRCIKQSALLSAVVMLEAVLHRFLGSYTDCISRFIVPSQFYLGKLVEWGMPATMFRHVPNFVEADRFAPKFEAGKEIVYFGRLSPEKGVDTLIRAAAEVGALVRVIGGGPALDSLRALAVESGASVVFSGYLTGDELRRAVAAARAVVVPSVWYENAPMTVLEAYALGKPVIGARIGGIPELVQDGQTGWLFESGNTDSLAEVLQTVIRSTDGDIERMGRTARRWVETQFTLELYRDRVLDVYTELGVKVG